MIEVPVKLDPTEFAPTSPARPSDKAHWSPIAPPPPFQYPKSPIVPVERVYESNEEYRPPLIERPPPALLTRYVTHEPEPAYYDDRDEEERDYNNRHHSDPHPGRRISGV
jgi:hypothetical protein